ncbi:Transferrin binding protein-like solute binding protein [Pasteurella testudinis DSM 23072]|uniref:Transferrin binding protein-like solute binding protein n=1 Tax=Pasteurella testudinis DSM 23072 TaxID=1122938 RepID=A0A1W1VBL3_9PAST|nr:Slam-dependent surface lipoprotein [Pasteurella testudinis]SMB90613.1 Transferrin binding protein-like solute binding protein [Pasteurella testudinis DSM 23072]SUB52841.1 Transferrin binding protein-like solute binding protein [Pasteurella testudinis]
MPINQSIKMSLTALCIAVLTACGGSGGGGGSDNANSTSTINNSGTASTTDSNTTNTATTAVSGQVLVTKGDTYSAEASSKLQNITTTNLKAITVDGITIQLERSGIYAAGWSTFNLGSDATQKNTITCCGTQQNVKIGAYDEGEDGASYLFYTGNPTAETQIPTRGSISYQGNSLYSPYNPDFDEDYYQGSTNLVANFDSKSLSGELKSEVATITVVADISGNGFSGQATSSAETANAQLQGKFYGTNAQEIGGIASANERDSRWGVVFSGKQQ